jgi:hypothetical protein
MKYAVFSADGLTAQFYTPDVHGVRTKWVPDPEWTPPEDDPDAEPPLIEVDNPGSLIPAEAVEIDEAIWREWLSNPGRRQFDAATGTLAAYTPPDPPFEETRAAAQAEVDRQAEVARRTFITAGSGQALEYEQTRAEADAAGLAADPLDPAAFPMLEAERAALETVGQSLTLREVAAQVLAEFAAWQSTGAEIKRVRRTAKLQIAAAPDNATVDVVVAGLVWPTP